MALTPVDILHTEFKTAIRGYNKSQVDEFIKSASDALESALKEKAELQRRIDALQEEIEQVRAMKSAMTDALTLAQKSADEVRASAHKQAEVILQEAEQSRIRMTTDVQRDAEKFRTEIALLEATRDRFETEFRAMLNGYIEWLDKQRSHQELKSEVA